MNFRRIYFAFKGGRQYDDEGRRRNDDDQPRRGGGHDRDRYSGPSRRDYDSNRSNKYNHPDRGTDRENNREMIFSFR